MAAHLIDNNSTPSGKSELDLFSVPSTQVAIKHGFWADINPMNTLTNQGPFEFRVPSDPHFLDLSKNYIYFKVRITRANAAALRWAVDNTQDPPAVAHAEDKVGPVNLFGKTFFQQVKLYMNSTLVYDSNDTYAYRAYLETALNYGEDVKKSLLQTSGYESDSVDLLDNAENVGWGKRCQWFQGSRTMEFMAPLHIDLFHQEKYLINQMELRLELHRNKEAFCLMSYANNPPFEIQIQDMKWFIRKVNPADSVTLGLEKILNNTTLKYPIRRVQIKTVHLDAGRRDTPTNTIFSGQIPRRVVVGLVENDAFHGNWEKSPFNFKHFSAKSIQLTAGGINYPPNPIEMDFKNNLVSRPYIHLYEALGYAAAKKSCWIDIEDFIKGDTIYAFDLSADSSDEAHWELIKEGSTTIRMTFDNAIPAGGAKLIVLGEFDNLISIDRFRNTYVDYTP